MSVLTEGKHTGEYIVWEADPQFSRETATVLSGQVLVAGQVVQLDGAGKIIAADGLLNSADAVITAPVGVMYDNVDATDGDVTGAVYTARDSVVNLSELTIPADDTDNPREAAYVTALKAIDIVAR
jgi:hypothetical protein